MHHGGAGTTAAGLRAGVPAIVIPFFSDQPFWGHRLAQLRVGTQPIPKKALTVERLTAALKAVKANEAMRSWAAALGEKIRAEDGVKVAVAAIINIWRTESMTEIDRTNDSVCIPSEALSDKSHELYYMNEISKLFCRNQVHLVRQVIQSFPPAHTMIQLRARHFDKMLADQIASGCKQVVILGAGLDTRAVRFAAPNVQYFEIDRADKLQQKAFLHQDIAHVTCIARDYLEPGLIEILQEHGFNTRLSTYFLWEGVVPNLQRGDIIDVLDALRNQVRQFQLSLDYLSHQMIVQSEDDAELNESIHCLENLGTTWATVFKDIPTFVRALGLRVVENLSTAELHARYYPQAVLPSKLLQFYYVCTIEKNTLW